MIFGPKALETPDAWRERWHSFFPLWPRHVPGVGYVWLETIERKQTFACGPAGGRWDSEYRQVGAP